ncbi:MAG: electron transfer flavoprotein subunit beta/FixA family protein [Candidatus Lokiarchaeota archaeon]|nr:electron transfer flavoprotein subunit beta/FixA family protein [Candidatus Lokiarchaeota archaeon]
MKIFVCIKQVPGVAEVKIDKETGLLVREGIPSIMNPVDKNALELALYLKEINEGIEIISISMGPPQAEEVLRESLAMGCDKAYLLTDRRFAGADTLATSHTLSLAIKTLIKNSPNEKYLVICGNQAIDGDTAQVGPELAEELNIPQITYVQKVEVAGDKLIAESVFRADEMVILETKLPALITVLKELNIARFPTISGIMEAFDNKEVMYLNADDVKANNKKIGLDGSQTQVWKIFVPEQKGDFIRLSGSVEAMAKDLCKYLKEDKVL